MKKIILILFVCSIFLNCSAQEVYKDTATQQESLFLGSIEEKNVKVLEQGNIKWKNREKLEQTGLLTATQFLNKIFNSGLCFEAEGYEPFWKIILTQNQLEITDAENGTKRAVKSEIFINQNTVGIYFSFISSDGKIFGTINYLGFQNQRICDYNLSDENSLYETLITINGKVYEGCSTVIIKN